MEDKLYVLRIRLAGVEPAIWRRFLVPGTISLDRLHDVIQIVMGWDDAHLHQFVIGTRSYTEKPESKDDGIESGRYRLRDLIRRRGRAFRYIYDFGDYWDHEIVLEDGIDPLYAPSLLRCMDGERACPPESVGGAQGYADFLRYSAGLKRGKRSVSATASSGRTTFESERFCLEAINAELGKYVRWTRDRLCPWNAP